MVITGSVSNAGWHVIQTLKTQWDVKSSYESLLMVFSDVKEN